MSSPQKNKNGCGGCLSIIAVTMIAIGAGYHYGRKFILGSELTPNSGASVIPAEAIMTGFISTDINDWEKLSQFGTTRAKQLVTQELENIKAEIASDNQDINYQQDIQPWLGNIMLAIIPNSPNDTDYNLVAVFGIKNKLKAFQFMQKIEQEKKNWQKNNYQNVDIFNFQGQDNQPVSVAILKNKLIVSDNQLAVQKIINTSKGDISLVTQTKYSQERQQKPYLNNMVMEFYFPNYDKLLSLLTDDNSLINNENIVNVNSMIMGLGIDNHGLQVQGKVNFNEEIDAEYLQPVSNDLIRKLPSETILMVNGSGINKLWQELEQQKEIIPDSSALIDEGKQFFQDTFNLDLEQDIFSWLDGEFVFGILPDQKYSLLNSGLKGLFFLETSNRNRGEQSFQKVEKAMRFNPIINSKSQNIQGIEVKEWTVWQTPVLAYGWLNDDSLAVSLGSKFEQINNINHQSSLLNDDTFKLTIKSLPQNNYGYVYWNVEKTLNFLNNFQSDYQEFLSPNTIAILESINAIAITSSSTNPITSQFHLNVTLEKSEGK